MGFGYDYESIMHYPMYSFTSNGRATIVPKDPKAKIGQRERFSDIDIGQLNKLYKCPKKSATTPATTLAPTTTPAPTTKPRSNGIECEIMLTRTSKRTGEGTDQRAKERTNER